MPSPAVRSDHRLLNDCSILLLAGGRGRRMGGRDKGWVQWQGQALVEHLHGTVRPLTDDLIISCNRNHASYAALADQLIQDPVMDFPGPLIGILEGLKVMRHHHLLILPCDTPLVDRALLQALHALAGPEPVMLRQGRQWQPLFSLLPRTLLPSLQAQWDAGQRSPRQALLNLSPRALDCHPDDPRLINFNDSGSLSLPLRRNRHAYPS